MMGPKEYTAQMATQKWGQRPTQFERPTYNDPVEPKPTYWDEIDMDAVVAIAKWGHYPARFIVEVIEDRRLGVSLGQLEAKYGVSKETIRRWEKALESSDSA